MIRFRFRAAARLALLLVLTSAPPAGADGPSDPTATPATASASADANGGGDPVGEPAGDYVESVTVTAPSVPPSEAASATKSLAPLGETPQAVTVVTAQEIATLGAQGVQDALNYAAGVRSDAFGLDSRTDSVLVRGGYPDEYLDGMRQQFNYYTSTTRTDPYLLERIEVLRGPSSMLYGQGTTAGIVALSSKRPRAVAAREVDLSLGSYDRLQARADLTGPLSADGRWLYRLVAVERDAATQVDHVPDDRSLFAPTISWQPSDRTSLTLQARWQQDRSGSTLQFLPWSGSISENPNGLIPTETFIGEPGFDRYDSERATAGWLFEHRFENLWTLRQSLRVTRNEVDYRSLYADSFSSPGDSFLDPEQRVIGRYAWVSRPQVKMWTADQNLAGEFATGPVKHHWIAGLDAVRFDESSHSAYDFPESQGGGVPSIDVYAPVPTGYLAPDLARDPDSSQEQAGLYLQDQLKFGAGWIVLAGLRHDETRSGLEGAATERDGATTGRLGLLWAAPSGWSPYLSYSESFTPMPGTDFYDQRYRPLLGKQIEAGLKFAPAEGAFTWSVAVFDLREENRLVDDPANPLNQLQAGETTTSGAELEVSSRFAGFDLSAHYNYLDNDATLDAVPMHQAAAWLERGFSLGRLGRISAGLGLRWFDSFREAPAPTVTALALVDGMLAWSLDRWHVTLNMTNLSDERYVSTCLARGDCFFGARRNLALTAGVSF
jgi:iron complex outermembrane recepter protein